MTQMLLGQNVAANYKLNGDTAFKGDGIPLWLEKDYRLAIDFYTRSLFINDDPVVYCNKAISHSKLEEWEECLTAASCAVKMAPSYEKAWFFQVTALIRMMKPNEAISTIQQILAWVANKSIFLEKLKEAQVTRRKILFTEAIHIPLLNISVALVNGAEIPPLASYFGPRLCDISPLKSSEDIQVSLSWIKDELVPFFKKANILPPRYLFQVIYKSFEIFGRDHSILSRLELDTSVRRLTICGDIHGQFFDLVNIFEINGWPCDDHFYLFNGDFVDRGAQSIETLILLLSLKCAFPDFFFMNRGNHESATMNRIYGFEQEINKKYSRISSELFELFQQLFRALPLCHVINSELFVSHGGIPRQGSISLEKIEEIQKSKRKDTQEAEIVDDLLWADPMEGTGIRPSVRGTSVMFGSDITEVFLKTNRLKVLIRSHEYKDAGYSIDHNGLCITIFSAPAYISGSNLGAFINFDLEHLLPDNAVTLGPMKFEQFNRCQVEAKI